MPQHEILGIIFMALGALGAFWEISNKTFDVGILVDVALVYGGYLLYSGT